MNIELTDIVTIVGTMGGIEGIKWGLRAWLNRKTDARKEDAAADALEIDNEKNQVGWLEERVTQRDLKIDALYVELRNEQADKLNWIHKYYDLELRYKEAIWDRCDVKPCTKREPPRGSALKKEEKKDEKE